MLSENESLILVAGRYEGIDERVIQTQVDEEWSIGDYVLSGGELPAMILMDAVVPLDQFAQKLEAYINSQRDHLNFEERELLPQIANALSEDDWKQIELKWKQTDSQDPLFGLKVAKKYQELAQRINQLR